MSKSNQEDKAGTPMVHNTNTHDNDDEVRPSKRRNVGLQNEGLEVFMWGDSDSSVGEPEGHENNSNANQEPVYLEELRGKWVRQISCAVGDDHAGKKALAHLLTMDGQLRQWGPSPVWSQAGNRERFVTSQTLIGQSVVEIASGHFHFGAVTATGALFTWGDGEMGQLGHNAKVTLTSPKLVEALAGISIQHVACGSDHTIVSTTQGKLFAWGSNHRGVTGHGVEQGVQMKPKQIESLKAQNVLQISACNAHNAAVTQSGHVYTWGWGKAGRLGHGNQDDCSVPKAIESLRGKHVTQAACGFFHTGIITEDGRLYTCGFNSKAQLGHGDTLDRLEPKQVVALEGISLRQISCGRWHSAVVCDQGRMYTWGSGSNGRLGHVTQEDVLCPKRVEKLNDYCVAHAMALQCHTVALVEPFSLGPGDLMPLAAAWRGLEKHDFACVTFKVENEYAHEIRGILCHRCPFFSNMLTCGMKESTLAVIEIENVRKEIFKLVLEYLRTDHIHVDAENGIELYETADMYGLPRLRDICFSWLEHNMTAECAARLLQQAFGTPHERLKNMCLNFVAKNIVMVSKTSGMCEIKDPALLLIIIQEISHLQTP